MRFGYTSVGSANLPKLLGTYELELHPLIERLPDEALTAIVNVGAAEGYYAVGLARMLPEIELIAFEADPVGRELLKATATWNEVDQRIRVFGWCSPSDLASALRQNGKRLVIMDVEGAELTLLDPLQVEELKSAYIIVELHPDLTTTELREIIMERFQATHRIEIIYGRDRTIKDIPSALPGWFVAFYGQSIVRYAMEEYRHCLAEWLFLAPISRISA